MPNKPLCYPMASHNITQGGRVGGKKNKTVQYKISGVRLKWKLTRNETQNSWSLILEGVYCVWIALGKQTSRLTEITALIVCARVIKALGSRLKSFTLQLTGNTLSIAGCLPPANWDFYTLRLPALFSDNLCKWTRRATSKNVLQTR